MLEISGKSTTDSFGAVGKCDYGKVHISLTEYLKTDKKCLSTIYLKEELEFGTYQSGLLRYDMNEVIIDSAYIKTSD
jgi:hypothetical protein